MIKKTLLLGTAQWGWTVPRDQAFRLLDTWLAAGYRQVDAATNYPINKIPADFRASERILREYIRAHGLHDLKITMKIGSLDNLRTPDIDLAPSFIYMIAEEYLRLFDTNLQTIMLHWDNREDEQPILDTLKALSRIQQEFKLRPGVSGVKYPQAYARANRETGLVFDIQIKHNILHSDLQHYIPLTGAEAGRRHRLFVYGINAGGLKLEGPYPAGSTYLARGGNPGKDFTVIGKIVQMLPEWNRVPTRPPISVMNEIGLVFAGLQPETDGIILGVSSAGQLQESLDFWKGLEVFDYSDVFQSITKLQGI